MREETQDPLHPLETAYQQGTRIVRTELWKNENANLTLISGPVPPAEPHKLPANQPNIENSK
jgi:hypothetical protein